jgi:hypothetical protein
MNYKFATDVTLRAPCKCSLHPRQWIDVANPGDDHTGVDVVDNLSECHWVRIRDYVQKANVEEEIDVTYTGRQND